MLGENHTVCAMVERGEIMLEHGMKDRMKVVVRQETFVKEIQKSKDDITPEFMRVAAYCRVSTDLEEQKESFKTQEEYYTSLITKTPGWYPVGVYADRGISGTQRKNRNGFQRMIRHCEEGKIDKIICKSISRFSRNTLDLIEVLRRLKEMGISVFFEKERLDTFSGQSEFLISTLAAIAQEESRSISENMTWSFKKRFQRGDPVFKKLLGYDVMGRSERRKVSINKNEVNVVKEIYALALQGKDLTDIARMMIRKGYKKANGRNDWSSDYVRGILSNERYTGDVLCQKTYTRDHLTHKRVINRGEVQQYYIEDYHLGIIGREVFEAVQKAIASGKKEKPPDKNVYPLSSKIACGSCGAIYHRYSSHYNPMWMCSKKLKSIDLCDSDGIREDQFDKIMLKAFEARYGLWDQYIVHKLKVDINQFQDEDHLEYLRTNLKDELYEALKKEISANDEHERALIVKHRIKIEERLEEQERFWCLLEKDREIRKEILKWLEGFSGGVKKLEQFLQQFSMVYRLAWVIGITVLSKGKFLIRWCDNTEDLVEIED
jgi:site-specific DNA recombinase